MADSVQITANIVDGTSITGGVSEGVSVTSSVVEGTTVTAAVVTGAKGDKGDTGATGAKGDTGDTGPQGIPGVVQSIVAGTNVTVDSTDPANPVVSSTGGGGGGGVTDHGALTGLSNDDHIQYHNDTRGDVRYYQKAEIDTALSGKQSVGDYATNMALDAVEADYYLGKQPIIKPITIFDSGNGFVKNSLAGTQHEDITDGFRKNNSLVLTTDGDGQSVTSRRLIAPFNFTDNIPVVAFKVDNIANLSEILFKFSSDEMTSSWFSMNPNSEAFRLLDSGAWMLMNLSFSTVASPRNGGVDYSPVVGSPDKSSINMIEISVKDKATSPVSVKFGLIGYTKEPKRPAVSLTFDDGYLSQYTLARSKMDEYGMPGVAYVNSESIGWESRMNIAQLRAMQDNSGWDISAHTHSHADLTTITSLQIEEEFKNNKNWLVANGFARGANHLAYPFGLFDYSKVIPLAKKYFASARTIASYPESLRTSNPYALRTYYAFDTSTLQQMKDVVTRAIEANEWVIFIFHRLVVTPTGVGDDFPKDKFDAFIDWLATQDIDVRTVSDVIEGIKSPEVAIDPATLPISTATKSYVDSIAPIFGTGFPNGVITAPMGSVYIDKAITSGASSWIKKSGTSNTGWLVSEADTGWRAITSWNTSGTITGSALPSGVSPTASTAGGIYIRREGNEIFWRIFGATYTALATHPVPSGFSASGKWVKIPLLASNNGLTFANIGGSIFMGANGIVADGTYGFHISYTTTDAWPTTLPGTAV